MDIFDAFIGIMIFVLICVIFSPAKKKNGNNKN